MCVWNQVIRTGVELVPSTNLLIALIRTADRYPLSELR